MSIFRLGDQKPPEPLLISPTLKPVLALRLLGAVMKPGIPDACWAIEKPAGFVEAPAN